MDSSFEERYAVLRMGTIAGLFGDYAHTINRTNEVMADDAFAEGRLGWDGAFTYEIPRDVILAELRRMEDWIIAHRAEVDAAREATMFDELRDTSSSS